MARVHLNRPLQDNLGNLITDATVALYEPGTTTPIGQTLYDSLAGVGTRSNPFAATNGYVDAYLDSAALVRVGITRPSLPEVFIEDIAVGDPEEQVAVPPVQAITMEHDGDLVETTTGKRFYINEDSVIVGVRASVTTAPTGQSAIIDVLKNGTSLWAGTPANRPTISDGDFTALGGAPDSDALVAEDYLQFVIDQIGTTIDGADLVVQVLVQKAP